MWFLFKILHVRGRNICLYKGELCFILLGGVFTFLLFYELFFRFLYTSLVTIFTYIVLIFDIYIYIYDDDDDVSLLHLSLHMLFLFSLYTHVSIVCNLLFLFYTKISWWVLFEVFQKYRLSKSSMPWTLIFQNISKVCVRIDFIVFNK